MKELSPLDLEDFEFSPILEGDVLPTPPDGGWGFDTLFDPYGQPLSGDYEAGWRRVMAIKKTGEHHFTATLRFEEHEAFVSTVYLGMNHNWLGGPPLIWETMVQTNGEWSGFQSRYCTRNAALNGHNVVVQALEMEGFSVTEAIGM